MSPPYLIPSQIKEIFENRHNQSVFNSHFADNASIIIVGQDDTIGGHYKSTQHFDEVVFDRMSATMKMETARMEVVQVIGGGESATAAVEIVARCTTKLDKPFFSEYVELVRFNSDGKIEWLKVFPDHSLLQSHLEEHEG